MSVEIIKNNLSFKGQLQKRKDTVLIILHHQAGKGQTVKQIHEYHKNKLGWAGIGYHFFIDFNGNIFEGRPINTIGAHCNGNNSKSIGICLEGDFRYDKPTNEQIKSLKELVSYIKEKYPSIGNRVLNHNDLYKTLCPVVDLKNMIK